MSDTEKLEIKSWVYKSFLTGVICDLSAKHGIDPEITRQTVLEHSIKWKKNCSETVTEILDDISLVEYSDDPDYFNELIKWD